MLPSMLRDKNDFFNLLRLLAQNVIFYYKKRIRMNHQLSIRCQRERSLVVCDGLISNLELLLPLYELSIYKRLRTMTKFNKKILTN